MTEEIQEQWGRCLAFIKSNIEEQSYTTWFAPISLGAFDGKKLRLNVPSSFIVEFIEAHFLDILGTAVTREFGEGINISYRVMVDQTNKFTTDVLSDMKKTVTSTGPASSNQAPTVLQAHESVVKEDLDPNLNPIYTFDNFIEGTSNKLTRRVGLSIVDKPQQTTFNPFFIYGASGVGKTHLASAIGLSIKERYPEKRVLYISAHLFQVQYTDSVLKNRTNDFITFYQSIDVLILDDVQEFVSAKRTQMAFFHIFNHLHQLQRQIIMTCDRPPSMLDGMEDRLLTRFKWGMIGEIEKPNIKLRKDILLNKLKHDSLKFPTNVINYIVGNVTENVRDMEGIVNSILAYSVVDDCEIDLDLAERVVARSVKITKKPLTVDLILQKVCEHYHVSDTDVFSSSRKRPIVEVRQIAMYLSQKHIKLSYAQIGQLIGKRDHSTVMHSCNLIEKRISVDKAFRQELEEIEGSLQK